MLSPCEDLCDLLSTFEGSSVLDGWVEEAQSWADYGFEEGVRVLLMFQGSDWDELSRLALQLPNTSRHFLAQWLSSSEDPRANRLLCSLLPIGEGSAWFMCAESLGYKLLRSPRLLEEEFFVCSVAASFEASQRGVVSFVNRPIGAGEGFSEYLARYKHMLNPEVLALVEHIQSTRGNDA